LSAFWVGSGTSEPASAANHDAFGCGIARDGATNQPLSFSKNVRVSAAKRAANPGFLNRTGVPKTKSAARSE
jgi:hypothetical protein